MLKFFWENKSFFMINPERPKLKQIVGRIKFKSDGKFEFNILDKKEHWPIEVSIAGTKPTIEEAIEEVEKIARRIGVIQNRYGQ